MRIDRLTIIATVLLGATATAQAYETSSDEDIDYLFAWPFVDTQGMAPRGGTTRAEVPSPVSGATPEWRALQADDIDGLERDRRAIRAMAGAYRVSFDFLETVGFAPGFEPARPYRSWGTEYVYVVADEPEFISLQHVLVMVVEDEDGNAGEPMVTKHWRQDWRYQDDDLHEYVADGVWERTHLSPERAEGRWTQAVFQVDDSPRYESVGRWRHHASHSSWRGSETRRPLPRREFSVRDDYDLLVGTNRHTILPTGWVHEQDNLKAVVDDDGRLNPERPFLAREYGVNRYRRIEGFDFSAGDAYWRVTADFWALVREAWSDRLAAHDRIEIEREVEGQSMMMTLLEMAGEIADGDDFDAETAREDIEALFERHVSAPASD